MFKYETQITYVKMLLKNTVVIPAGSVLSVTLTGILQPPSLAPLSGFIIFSGDTDFNKIEEATYPALTNDMPGDDDSAFQSSVAEITTLTGVLEEDQTYQFTIYTTNDIPLGGFWTLQIPTEVGLPDDPASDLVLTCVQ